MLGLSEVNPSRSVTGAMRERGNLPGIVSPETPITTSPVCAKSPPAEGEEAPAAAINANMREPSSRTSSPVRDPQDETACGSVVSVTGPIRYTGT